ncbi:MAG TPA: histidine phosphatase family protein [Dehalococcoidia bacterium]|nr:histidine phosphatase family protein [Dehalococcoidia bacterium]
MTEFILVRHGSTRNLELQQWQGWSSVPLSALGREQANALANWIAGQRSIDRVFSSPIARARETADIIAAATGATVQELDALRERMTATRLWGVAHADSRDYAAAARDHRFDPGWRYEDEEPWPEVAARVLDVISLMRNLSGNPSSTEASFVLVTHGITLRMIAAALLTGAESPVSDWLRVSDNLGPLECCSVTRFVADGDNFHLARWNEIAGADAVQVSSFLESGQQSGQS